MGLDIVEYVMAVEDAFEIRLPDDRLSAVRSPRDFAALVADFVPPADAGPCLSQRAFYRLRRAMMNRTDLPRRAIRLESVLVDLLPAASATELWAAICAELQLPKPLTLRSRHGVLAFLGARPTRFGDAVQEFVARYPSRLLGVGEGWTASQIQTVLADLLSHEQGIAPGSYSLDASYVQDLRMD